MRLCPARDTVGLFGAVLIGRHAALGQEGAVEGALIPVAAQIGNLGDGVAGVAQQSQARSMRKVLMYCRKLMCSCWEKMWLR